ncbi:MAG: hypothetical protein NZ805_05065 [Armatimonadetes bacterium]|nr:hypothetical protein [Armatimonadota bacterium]MDW8028822.1 hypothetical protein [Armatimonadota bacterium]
MKKFLRERRKDLNLTDAGCDKVYFGVRNFFAIVLHGTFSPVKSGNF